MGDDVKTQESGWMDPPHSLNKYKKESTSRNPQTPDASCSLWEGLLTYGASLCPAQVLTMAMLLYTSNLISVNPLSSRSLDRACCRVASCMGGRASAAESDASLKRPQGEPVGPVPFPYTHLTLPTNREA